MKITFHPKNTTISVWDFHEVAVRTHNPVPDPFRTVCVTATCGGKQITGFCDAQDGSVYRIRFLAERPGTHEYVVRISAGETKAEFAEFTGSFVAEDRDLKGLLRTDGWGFRWSGTGETFFWNATTAYLMAGLRGDAMIAGIDRLAALGVNRLRVSLCASRQADGQRWHEPQVGQREDFTYSFAPWLCAAPDVFDDPRPDVTRFDVAHWQKFERLLAHTRRHNMIVQVIFFTDGADKQNYPFARPVPKAPGASDYDAATCPPDENESHYYAYAAARFAAFANVEWCLTNEWALFQSNTWVETMGTFLQSQDPYGHLMSVHGHGHFPFRESAWCTHALFQVWDEKGGWDWLLQKRAEQAATGRILPQVNEEYGYEDHYPGPWGGGRTAPARSADTRRRLACEITMAGGWQTTGESAANGMGGWINGLGDDSMTMLAGYRILKEFFESFSGERMEPRPDLAEGAMCVAKPGFRYLVYLPSGSLPAPTLTTEGDASRYRTRWFNPRSGDYAPSPIDAEDWVMVVESGDADTSRKGTQP